MIIRQSLVDLFGTQSNNGIFVGSAVGRHKAGDRGKQHRNTNEYNSGNRGQIGAGIDLCHIVQQQVDGNDQQLSKGNAYQTGGKANQQGLSIEYMADIPLGCADTSQNTDKNILFT